MLSTLVLSLALAQAAAALTVQYRYGDGSDPFQPYTSPRSRAQEMLRERGYNPYPFQNFPTVDPSEPFRRMQQEQAEHDAQRERRRE